MKIETVHVGFLPTNCYILSSDKGNCAIIDPGYNADRILKAVSDAGLNVKYILVTHGHVDHISAINDIVRVTGAKVAAPTLDAPMMDNTYRAENGVMSKFKHDAVFANILYDDGDTFEIDELTVKAMHTPGHTPGSSLLFCGDVIFSGDTLFAGCVGRTDLMGGNTKIMRESLQKIAAIKEDYRVLPGHDMETTLLEEQKSNPYLRNFEYDIYD